MCTFAMKKTRSDFVIRRHEPFFSQFTQQFESFFWVPHSLVGANKVRDGEVEADMSRVASAGG